MESLLEATKVDLPGALVEMEIERLMEQMRQDHESTRRADAGKWVAGFAPRSGKTSCRFGLDLAEVVKSNELQARAGAGAFHRLKNWRKAIEDADSVVKYFYSNPQQIG